MMQSTAGIDVGKRELDVSVDEDRARRFANTAAGVAELVGWLGFQGPCWRFVKPLADMKHWWCRRCARLECRCILPIPTRSGPLLGPVVIRPRPTV